MSKKLPIHYRLKLKVLKLILNKREFSLLPFSWKGFFYQTGWFLADEKKQSISKEGEAIPWITYSFYFFMDSKRLNNKKVFEYGAGNSTLYFNRKGADVYSVDHDSHWYAVVKNKIAKPDQLYFKPLSDDKAINDYIDAVGLPATLFDIIFIDGRYRRRCLLNAERFLTADGIIILDNSERSYYSEGVQHLLDSGFRKIDFWGSLPLSYGLSCTTIFYRDNNFFGI
jgi:hypothetical protein